MGKIGEDYGLHSDKLKKRRSTLLQINFNLYERVIYDVRKSSLFSMWSTVILSIKDIKSKCF